MSTLRISAPSIQPTPKPPKTYKASVEPISALVISDVPEERASQLTQKATAGKFNSMPINASSVAFRDKKERTIVAKRITKKLKRLKTLIRKVHISLAEHAGLRALIAGCCSMWAR